MSSATARSMMQRVLNTARDTGPFARRRRRCENAAKGVVLPKVPRIAVRPASRGTRAPCEGTGKKAPLKDAREECPDHLRPPRPPAALGTHGISTKDGGDDVRALCHQVRRLSVGRCSLQPSFRPTPSGVPSHYSKATPTACQGIAVQRQRRSIGGGRGLRNPFHGSGHKKPAPTISERSFVSNTHSHFGL